MRLDFGREYPEATRAMTAIDAAVEESMLEPKLLE